ncbi:hemin uptake protein HemP [Hoeflea prorocentri]|uniref:Hemin uptake protein HemP n=1 Tax=Hoeflea prorocentri TaxID=1922333 RepID=A0A9X3ZG03_9HYPH|nr:hemin uptake protein HemP [Hoeflea prorocentri]MCY6379679.1 hemin uptake protein HemP [Hoeflea prorocentri]MDA5397479.1 hemin uptake protein HemP [Hoeflea prorocentri]
MQQPSWEPKTTRQGEAENSQTAVRTLKSQDLFLGAKELNIDHHGAIYRLKITRHGKLILNK